MGTSDSNRDKEGSLASVAASLKEVSQKVEVSLLDAIQEHTSNDKFEASQGLDFLDSKNSLLLSYLIDLTFQLRQQLIGKERNEECLDRLIAMKVTLDKMRGLDKKLRYQIDKLLAAASNGQNFAMAGEDPLQFRPNADALKDDDDGDDSESSSSDEDDERSNEDDDHDSAGSADIDDDLAAARQTLALAKQKRNKKTKDDVEDKDDSVYRAPRLQAMPYTHDQEDKQASREKRLRRRMRASEVAQTLRSQYGDAPDVEDIHGGSQLGKQRAAARRFADQEAERTKFEEENMMRLTTSRSLKKERKRLMREEKSNLSSIAEIGNIVRESAFGIEDDRRKGRKNDDDILGSKRHANGRRKKQRIDRDGRVLDDKKGGKSMQAKNSLQAALYGGDSGKKKNRKR